MGIRKFKPVTPGTRWRSVSTFEELSGHEPYKPLLEGLHKHGGRNNTGRITSRGRSGGHRRAYRIIDFKRDKDGVPGKVFSVEYDPNRNARISLIHYADGDKRYILTPLELKVGDTVMSGVEAEIRPGNCLPLANIPVGTKIHNIELKIGKGGQMARSAGSFAQLVAREGDYAQLRLPSSEVRNVHIRCRATIGQVGNIDHENLSLGKAGVSRWAGIAPLSRGVVKNPVDHPHGGGEGKSSGGRHPVTPWGIPTKGYKTRKNKSTAKFIVRRRVK